MEALDKLDLNENQIEDLYEWFSQIGISLTEDEDIDVENVNEEELDDLIDDEELDGEEIDTSILDNTLLGIDIGNTPVKINDPVKMYLKEIGRVPFVYEACHCDEGLVYAALGVEVINGQKIVAGSDKLVVALCQIVRDRAARLDCLDGTFLEGGAVEGL